MLKFEILRMAYLLRANLFLAHASNVLLFVFLAHTFALKL